MRYAVFYVLILESDKDGLFVDDPILPYLGGIVHHKATAELLAKHISNDRSMPGAVIPKIMPVKYNIKEEYEIVKKYFSQLTREIYDMEENRMRK